MSNDQIKIMDRVKKLLALGDSSSEAEASSAIAKAQELLKQYNLELSDLDIRDSEVVDEVYKEMGRTQGWKSALMNRVTEVNYCMMYIQPVVTGRKQRKTVVRTFKFVGRPHNVAVCKATMDYLFGVIERMSKVLSGEGRSEIESYKAGIADTLISRLKEIQKKEVIETESRALVVQEKAVVEKYIQDRLSDLKTVKTQHSIKNWDFYAKGRSDGKNISLNAQIQG